MLSCWSGEPVRPWQVNSLFLRQNFPYFRGGGGGGGGGGTLFWGVNLVGKSPRNHKQDCKSAGHAQKKPHLLICACIIKNIAVSAIADAAGPEKQ